MLRMRELSDEPHDRPSTADVDSFGELLQRRWELKNQAPPGTGSDQVQQAFGRARAAEALGGKLLGAGGGGFIVLFAPPVSPARVREVLEGSASSVPIRLPRNRGDTTGAGVKDHIRNYPGRLEKRWQRFRLRSSMSSPAAYIARTRIASRCS
jgi:hypothetical protein